MKTGYDELVALFRNVSDYAIKHPEATEIHEILSAYDQHWRAKADDLSGRLVIREQLDAMCKDAVGVLSKATVGAGYEIPYTSGTFLEIHEIHPDRVYAALRKEMKPFNSSRGYGKNMVITIENDEENKCWKLRLRDIHEYEVENEPKIRHHKPARRVKVEVKKRKYFTRPE